MARSACQSPEMAQDGVIQLKRVRINFWLQQKHPDNVRTKNPGCTVQIAAHCSGLSFGSRLYRPANLV